MTTMHGHARRNAPRFLTAARWMAVTIAVIGLIASAGCKNTNFLSTRDEVRIGASAAHEIESSRRVDKDSPDAERVKRIAQRLMAHDEARPGVPYAFKVLDVNEINAVSLPGGPVYVYRGLLDVIGDDDDALACVIAHEVAHINARHAAKQISQQMAANLGIALILKGNTAQNVAGLAQDLLSMNYSREDEYDADLRGLSYAYRAGFDPRGMVRFFAKLQSLEKKQPSDPVMLRTHPLTRNRIQRAQKMIEGQDYRYGN
jgi:beta-barrel assembly-enhancing protease